MKLLLVTGDEFTEEEIIRTLEETEADVIKVFDSGCKAIIEVPDELPKDDDYKDMTLVEYWSAVVDELFWPCCTKTELTPTAYVEIFKGRHFEFEACLKKGGVVSALISEEEANKVIKNQSICEDVIRLKDNDGNQFTIPSRDILHWAMF